MEPLKAVEQLASGLYFHKQYKRNPYTLLLTSDVPFTPEVRQDVCRSTNWEAFQAYLEGRGSRESMDILMHALRNNHLDSGYQALAHLVQLGYFTTILTCDPDTQLEAALGWPDTLVVGRHSDKEIADYLMNPPDIGVHIIKLHGCFKGKNPPAAFPRFLAFPRALQEPLKHCLNRDMLVVGSIAHDRDITSLLIYSGTDSLYYIVPAKPDAYDEIIKALEVRERKLDQCVIYGQQGAFNTFFRTLEDCLEKMQAQQVETLPEPRPLYRKQAVKADVLLMTVNEIETKAVLELFPDRNLLHGPHYTYHDLGYIEGARVFLVQQATMGSNSEAGTQSTVHEAIGFLSPSTIIMIGVAFGLDQDKQQIGDVLVSRQIQTYDHQRVSTGGQDEPVVYLRGSRPTVAPRLLSRFKSGAHSWPAQNVTFGLLLSGEKLVDHPGYRDQIRSFAPEALGGEMEGAGLYAATHTHKVDWILVKAISDWGDGNKGLHQDQYQHTAARNAARFAYHVLHQGGFTDS